MFEKLLLIFWISSKSYSKAELHIQEVSKGKRLYYQLDGVPHSITIQSNFESLVVRSNVVIDLGWTHFISTVLIDADINDDGIVSVTLKGYSPHSNVTRVCSEDKKFTGSVVFRCRRPTRFIILGINQILHLRNVDVNGQEMNSEVFAGCYEYSDVRNSVSVSEISSCIYICQQMDNYYAGYMEQDCFCFEDLTDLEPNDLDYCTGICEGDEDFCGLEQHVLLYFAANYSYDADYPEEECVSHQKKCTECMEAEWTGINCRIRDCNINKGGCGEFRCVRSHDMYMDASFCSCKKGYNPLFMGTCVDIDECSTRNNTCQQQLSNCENTLGSYRCICSPGLMQAGDIRCRDIDECRDETRCEKVTTECINTWASYYCKCKTGYEGLTADGCQDIDECAKGLCRSGSCENTVGSFQCNCSDGFLFKNDNCEDIDECSGSIYCNLKTTYCINIEGSFQCSCKSGHKRLTEYHCRDIDECLLQRHACAKTVTCVNTIGSYLCKCETGFTPISYTYVIVCEDIDECEGPVCDNRTSFCVNHLGGYKCHCLNGMKHINDYACTTEKENVTQHKEVAGGENDPTLDLMGMIKFMAFGIFGMLSIIIISMLVSFKKTSKREVDVISDGTLSIESIL